MSLLRVCHPHVHHPLVAAYVTAWALEVFWHPPSWLTGMLGTWDQLIALIHCWTCDELVGGTLSRAGHCEGSMTTVACTYSQGSVFALLST